MYFFTLGFLQTELPELPCLKQMNWLELTTVRSMHINTSWNCFKKIVSRKYLHKQASRLNYQWKLPGKRI